MSDPVAEALLKVLERLDALEAKIDGPVLEEEDFAGWDEFPDLSVVPDIASSIEPQPRPTRAIHKPGQGFDSPLGEGLLSETEWVAGEAKIPGGIVEGSSSGHRLTEKQLERSWQKDMIAPMRQRPVEDAV